MATEHRLSRLRTLPLVIWRGIVRQLLSEDGTNADESEIYLSSRFARRQRRFIALASVCDQLRDAMVKHIYSECIFLLNADGEPLNHLAYNKELVASYVETLYLKLNATEPVSPGAIVANLSRLLPTTMHSLRSIIIEASAHVTRSAGYDFSAIGNAVHMPKLVDIHVVGQFMSERSARLQNTAALALARGLATMSGVTLRGLTLNKNRPNFVSHTVVVPLWVNASPTRGLHSRGMAVTVLRFSDVDAVEGGAELVRAVRDTLLHLTFMRCSYNQLATLLYSVDGEPLQYPNLCAIHGALSRGGESRVFNVPKGAFPKLEYLHEAVGYAWQSRMGVVSHLLFNKLSEIELPRLRAIRLRTSRLMTLNHAHLPALEHVSYYTRSELPERLEGPEVCSQLIDLLRHPTLTYLQYYDQLPAVGLLSRLDVKCCNLRYLDVGLITISYENVECILAALSHLCSLTLSISDRWSAIQRKDSRIQLTPLSASVQLLGMYIAAGDPDLQHDSSAVTPSRMIMSRLPMLRKLCLQDSVDSARRFLNLMKQEQRFAWSQNVADNVKVVCMDLFGRAI